MYQAKDHVKQARFSRQAVHFWLKQHQHDLVHRWARFLSLRKAEFRQANFINLSSQQVNYLAIEMLEGLTLNEPSECQIKHMEKWLKSAINVERYLQLH